MVCSALASWNLADLHYLFIENVGNLICSASYDLGEDLRCVLFFGNRRRRLAVEISPIFNTADVAHITQLDLAAAVEFDADNARANIQAVRL